MEPESVARACETVRQFAALGHEAHTSPLGLFVRNPELPVVYDANHVSGVRAGTAEEIDRLLKRADESLAPLRYRRFFCDPLTPSAFEARLALEGYEEETTLQLLLQGELQRGPESRAEAGLRLAESDADWRSLATLMRLDQDEQAVLQERPAYSQEVSDQLVRCRRLKCPPVRFWLARAEGRDCGYFASWPGRNGIGIVEHLFTHPDFRHRGIATALIERAVADARERGAGPVVIGALPDDTPRRMYAALGFRPLCLTRGWLKRS